MKLKQLSPVQYFDLSQKGCEEVNTIHILATHASFSVILLNFLNYAELIRVIAAKMG
jgi:hypothetical protein